MADGVQRTLRMVTYRRFFRKSLRAAHPLLRMSRQYKKEMYLNSTELNVSGIGKECKYFLVDVRRTCAPRHSCSLLFLAYLRFASCHVFISALESSIFIFMVHS